MGLHMGICTLMFKQKHTNSHTHINKAYIKHACTQINMSIYMHTYINTYIYYLHTFIRDLLTRTCLVYTYYIVWYKIRKLKINIDIKFLIELSISFD